MISGSLAERLRVLRAQRGMTLVEAAERAGVGRDTLSDLERGRRHPVMPTLAKIAKGYGVPVEALLEEPAPLADASEAGRLEEEPSPAVEVQERREPGVKTASAHIHGQGSLRAEGTVLRIASPDLQAIIRGAVRGELSEEEAMAAAHEKAETV